MGRLLVLNYHRLFAETPETGNPYREFTLEVERFREQMAFLHSTGIPVVGLQSTEWQSASGLQVAITFDDGHVSDLIFAAPILEEYGFNATFFPVCNNIGQPGYLSAEQIQELEKRGYVIGSHGLSHRDMRKLTPEEQAHELRQSRVQLKLITGKPIESFAFPYGRYNKQLLSRVSDNGYKQMVSTRCVLNRSGNSNLIHRWNIKHSTQRATFQKMIQQNSFTIALSGTTDTIKRLVRFTPFR